MFITDFIQSVILTYQLIQMLHCPQEIENMIQNKTFVTLATPKLFNHWHRVVWGMFLVQLFCFLCSWLWWLNMSNPFMENYSKTY
eukprot:UN23658